MYDLNCLYEKHCGATNFLLHSEPLTSLLNKRLDNFKPGGKKLGDELAYATGLMLGAETALWISLDSNLRRVGIEEYAKVCRKACVNDGKELCREETLAPGAKVLR